ncbi:MAG: ATP-binding protein, partial [Pikeienuella sp.]
VSSAPTSANKANLASSFLQQVEKAYGGTALGRQELAGEMVLERPGALWTRANVEAIRCGKAPDVKRIVVAVDPPATSGAGADECGVVVAALGVDDCGYVLADKSSQGESPQTWAARVVKAYHEFGADRIIAEVNQGGDLVEAMIRQVDPSVSYRAVRATRGKATRAEPISALYEQGRIRHVGAFTALEDQMCAFGAEDGECRSPDRVDALVWAMTDLMLRTGAAGPRARRL